MQATTNRGGLKFYFYKRPVKKDVMEYIQTYLLQIFLISAQLLPPKKIDPTISEKYEKMTFA